MIANGVNEGYLDRLLPSLSGDDHRPVTGDSSLEETARRAVRAALDASRRVDVLVNNVGRRLSFCGYNSSFFSPLSAEWLRSGSPSS